MNKYIMANTDTDTAVEQFKLKKMFEQVASYRGNGTSLITIMIQAGGDINGMKQTLVEELGTASNIKSRVNRLSVLSAITSAQHKLKQYAKVPPNGLVVFCGELTDDTKSKKISLCFSPFKPLLYKMYMCDSKFHVEPLADLLRNDKTFGFVIIDGNGALFATLSGDYKSVLYHFKVDLPNKHGRGGQSALRYSRLTEAARQVYVMKVTEMMEKYYIGDNHIVNVAGIIVAGSAEMKDKLLEHKDLDPRLKKAVISTLTIAYGGNRGLEEAIGQSMGILSDLKCINEKKEVQAFLELIAKDTDPVCYGINQTMAAVMAGAVDKLLVSDKLGYHRIVISYSDNITPSIIEYTLNTTNVLEKYNGEPGNLKIDEDTLLLDWLLEHYKEYVKKIVIVSDNTSEGTQFYKGFGGLGGILSWKFDCVENGNGNNDSDSDDSEFI